MQNSKFKIGTRKYSVAGVDNWGGGVFIKFSSFAPLLIDLLLIRSMNTNI